MSRVVLILGCSTGIGRAVMERLTVSGCAVVATAGRAESLKSVAASTGLVDVTDSAATDFAVAAIPRRHGRIDVLLNDAGCAGRGVVEEVPGAAVEAMVDVNVFGVSRMVRPVAAVCDNAAGDVVRGEVWRSPRPVGAVCTGTAR
jgi:NADP-dependent 3-hydroxy acid dehydrogenase YdfG